MKIGALEVKTNVFPAPLAGISDRAFRDLTREFGAELTFTEMISSEGLFRGDKNTTKLLDIENEPGPVSVQLFGNNPDSFAKAAVKLNSMNVQAIDINMGCPVKKVVNNSSGSGLMTQPQKAEQIVRAVKANTKLPLTVKIRSGWDAKTINAVEFSQMIEEAGADAIIVHPRTRAQQFRDKSDWSIIKAVKDTVKIPVIGNGDILKPSDGYKMIQETNCDGIMIGRGILGNPWLFANVIRAINGENLEILDQFFPSRNDRADIIWKHANILAKCKGERFGLLEMRKHAIWYIKGLNNARTLRFELGQMVTLEFLKNVLDYIRDDDGD